MRNNPHPEETTILIADTKSAQGLGGRGATQPESKRYMQNIQNEFYEIERLDLNSSTVGLHFLINALFEPQEQIKKQRFFSELEKEAINN